MDFKLKYRDGLFEEKNDVNGTDEDETDEDEDETDEDETESEEDDK